MQGITLTQQHLLQDETKKPLPRNTKREAMWKSCIFLISTGILCVIAIVVAIFCLIFAFGSPGRYDYTEGTCFFKGPGTIQQYYFEGEDDSGYLYRAAWQVDVANDQGQIIFVNATALYNYGWKGYDHTFPA
eukprot:TRINITY_DN3811_c0_g1_i2.p1 TRINITY_DN3811_c0_g1~~TRINITY_DN3811_c0_g1_i2.p1  ORF type:complete len:132 (+),score=20.97 TRINITY_DN3811_c0_g1_i2:200-595(+)